MAKRLTTRLSAGAALVTGLGMVGIAAATPANAAIAGDLEYTCELTNEGLAKTFEDPWKVNLSVDAPDQVAPSEEIPAPEIVATVVPGQDAADQLRSLNVATLEGDSTAGYTFGGEEREVDLTIPTTDVPADGDITNVATGTGEAETAPAEEGSIDIVAGDFTADLTTDSGFVLNIACAAPDDATVGSITVGEGDDDGGEEQPEANDWFTEPQSLPIDENNVVTLEGTASQAGTITVEVLGEGTGDDGEPAPGEVLATHEFEVAEGDVKETFPLVEGAGYARVISQDCVDADGNDETVEGSGCNVTYKASWVGGNDDGSGDDNGEPVDDGDDNVDDGAGDDSGDDATGDPEVPEVVQTDGFTPVGEQPQDNTLALTLGGLLLAGAGAGTVLVARRRAATQR
ncbi:MAG TPA: hypothetical protein H9805_02720 [Candidatus Janibacter merdipullorum]|nr:hypothetical protein [Candidatus Janibacter merdipullorum]